MYNFLVKFMNYYLILYSRQLAKKFLEGNSYIIMNYLVVGGNYCVMCIDLFIYDKAIHIFW